VEARPVGDEVFCNGLECARRENFSEVVGHHSVDHLALDRRLTDEYSWQAVAWHSHSETPRLSDHNGLTVTLSGK
jgi:hypothetical protein